LAPDAISVSNAMLKGKHSLASLKDRLAAFAKDVREMASLLQPGIGKDELLRKARQADVPLGLLGQFAGIAAAKVTHSAAPKPRGRNRFSETMTQS
jgi:hypothetical protein